MPVSVGLHNIADNPNLTFITFMGLALVAVLGLRFGVYALRNERATGIDAHRPIWRLLAYAGLLALAYGVFGIVEIGTSLTTPYRGAVMLGVTLTFAVTIRQIRAATGEGSGRSARERLARMGFAGAVLVVAAGQILRGPTTAMAAIEGLAALAFVAYGAIAYRDHATSARLQGTMTDSLLRHLLPVLTFASLVSIVNVARPFGLDRIVVLHVQVVFVIMTATALMTATIKLQQNLAGL